MAATLPPDSGRKRKEVREVKSDAHKGREEAIVLVYLLCREYNMKRFLVKLSTAQIAPANSRIQAGIGYVDTSIGTGYDLSNSIFSPDGRNFQVSSGLLPDGRHFVSRARDEADNWRTTYKGPISTHVLASRLGGYAQAYTLYSSVRPFGVTSIIGGWDSELELPVDGEVGAGPKSGAGGKVASAKAGGPGLYMIEPSGLYWGYYGAATGKGRQAAKAELEKLDLASGNFTLLQGVKEAARIIYVAHEDSKDKDFELEMTWISAMDGPTKGRHEEVPKALLEEAIREAKQAMEGDDEDDEEEKQGEDEGDKMEE
ncbi:proteasome component C1 [Histoplasma capsulatum G186AR]|uniref:Proteasome component C1 n=1 Tax=Ajellomyces capsulatus (strain G186AR / H82 / ATCC MYA-2454 / RMSCC 2432) TaxID=447093 RepID=C0P133_AJECG|nr:proteasome component C1 [Histoplasma capsulatum G186AR]EEH02669.1 proteasome component C1 [Histoplasma capsulatum G186AR]